MGQTELSCRFRSMLMIPGYARELRARQSTPNSEENESGYKNIRKSEKIEKKKKLLTNFVHFFTQSKGGQFLLSLPFRQPILVVRRSELFAFNFAPHFATLTSASRASLMKGG